MPSGGVRGTGARVLAARQNGGDDMAVTDARPSAVAGDATSRRATGSTRAAVGPRLDRVQLLLMVVADAVILVASGWLAAAVLRSVSPDRAGGLAARDIVLTAGAMLVALHVHRQYDRPATRLRPSRWWHPVAIARCVPTGVLLALGTASVVFEHQRMTLSAAVAMGLPAVVAVPLGRRLILRAFRQRSVSRVLIVGTGPVADRVAARLHRCSDVSLVGHVDDAPQIGGGGVIGGLDELPTLCRTHRVDRVVVAFPAAAEDTVVDAVRLLGPQVSISVVPRMFELHSWSSEVEELQGLPLVNLASPSLGLRSRLEKRALDLAIAVPMILVTSPLWLVAAVAIKIDTRGPVFFRQERTGRGGRTFRVFKFRTMSSDAWALRTTVTGDLGDGPLFKMVADPRVTRVGALLRRTSLDELPQLLNVLIGQMSLVGPRPLPVAEADQLDGSALDRLHVTPGITGLWQVSGRSDLTYADLQHLDSVYVRSWSLGWDIRILLATPGAVFGQHGAY